MKAYVSKYALTSGIEELEVEPTAIQGRVVCKSRGCFHVSFHRSEHHETREAANIRAEQMRVRKIASLKKQIAKLETLVFVEPKNLELQ